MPDDQADNVPRTDAERAALWLLRGDHTPGESHEFDELLAHLASVVYRRYGPAVSPDESRDIAIEAVTRAIEGVRAGKSVEQVRNPIAWLTVSATHVAVDRLRSASRQRETPVGDVYELERASLENRLGRDDLTARTLDSQLTAQLVRTALKRARDANDALAYQVAVYMLDEAEKHNRLPSARAVGRALGVSHTGIQKALQRFRGYTEPPS